MEAEVPGAVHGGNGRRQFSGRCGIDGDSKHARSGHGGNELRSSRDLEQVDRGSEYPLELDDASGSAELQGDPARAAPRSTWARGTGSCGGPGDPRSPPPTPSSSPPWIRLFAQVSNVAGAANLALTVEDLLLDDADDEPVPRRRSVAARPTR